MLRRREGGHHGIWNTAFLVLRTQLLGGSLGSGTQIQGTLLSATTAGGLAATGLVIFQEIPAKKQHCRNKLRRCAVKQSTGESQYSSEDYDSQKTLKVLLKMTGD